MKKMFARGLFLAGLIVVFGLLNNSAFAAQIYVVNNSGLRLHSVEVDLYNDILKEYTYNMSNIGGTSTGFYDDIFSTLRGGIRVYVMAADGTGYDGCVHEASSVRYYFVRITVDRKATGSTETVPRVMCTFNFHN